MYTSKSLFKFFLIFLWIGILATACHREGKKQPDVYFDETGNHGNPHFSDFEKSEKEPEEEPVRVRDSTELARMKEYIANYLPKEDIVKTIEFSNQDICDCVALENQPAVKKLGLNQQQLHLQPPSIPEEMRDTLSSSPIGDPTGPYKIEELAQEYGTKDRICPENTVPIQRLTLEILDNFETLEDFFKARPPHDLTGPTDLHQYAYSYIYTDNWGSQSTLNVWSPYTEQSNEFSLSQIAVTRGTGSDKETIEAGWQKFRDLYGDYRPRLFIYFTPDNYGSGGCYNKTCGAFVQTSNSIYIGGGFSNISEHPHPSSVWEFTIRWQRHGETGDWWLKYGDIWVGYYPSSLFDNNGLKPRGSKASFYGEIIDKQTDERHTRTDMGSGHFPGDGYGYAAYQRRIRTITTNNVWNLRPSLSTMVDDANCYDINVHNSSGSWERYFYFGGPGYNTHCQ